MAPPKSKPAPITDGTPAEREPAALVGSVSRRKPMPKIPGRPQWVYAHPPDAYHVIGGQVLPDLRELGLAPGRNGIKANAKTGEIVARNYLGKKVDQGWTVLEDHRLTPDGQSYLHAVELEDGAVAWLPRWMRAIPGSSHTETDEEGYRSWLAWLVAEGHVPAPSRPALQGLARKLRAQLTEAEVLARTVPAKQQLADQYRRDLAAVDAALAGA